MICSRTELVRLTSAVGISQRPSVVLEQVLGELGQLPGAEHRLVPHQQRRRAFGVAVLARLQVEHELRRAPGCSRAIWPRRKVKRAPAFPRAGLEIHAQRRAEVGVFLRLEIEIARRAPARDLDIVGLVRAFGTSSAGRLGMAASSASSSSPSASLLVLERGHGLLELGDFGLERLGGRPCRPGPSPRRSP